MKHIQSKRLFESIESEEDIKDICIELEDDGFSITHFDRDEFTFTVGSGLGHPGTRLLIIELLNSNHQLTEFKYKRVEEVINRIKDYLGNKFINMYFQSSLYQGLAGRHVWMNLQNMLEMNLLDNISGIEINYKK